MKEIVKNMYDSIEMPEQTQKKILQAMVESKTTKLRPVWCCPAAIAVLLALVIAISPTARAAVSQWVVKYFWPDSDITIYEQVDENGDVVAIAGVDTEAPPFARIVNDRLYFLGNGEKIDITDQIMEEKPYYYTYVDEYGLTHAMAVGYSGSIENYGIYEFIWEETEGQKDWVTGTGRNFMSKETETRYPWVDIVWKDLGIPWPMPE